MSKKPRPILSAKTLYRKYRELQNQYYAVLTAVEEAEYQATLDQILPY